MKYLVIALTLISLSSCSLFQSNTPKIILNCETIGLQELQYYFKDGDRSIYVGINAIIISENGKEQKFNFDRINKVISDKSNLYIATKQGLMCYKFNSDDKPYLIPTPTKFNNPEITDIIFSKYDKSYQISTNGYGCFRLNNGSLEQTYITPAANCLAETADSSIWIGTNYGVVRLKNNETIRYSEEIVTHGFNVPDNIIEKLYVDPDNIMWIVMSEAISFASPSVYNSVQEHTELHSFPFIGSKSNKINGITKPKKGDDFWLFATDEGLFMLYGMNEEQSEDNGTKDKLGKLEGDVKRFKFANNEVKIRSISSDSDGNVQIVTDKSVWQLPRATILEWRKN